MEGANIPPPSAPGPAIGESSKLRSALDLLNITKVLALVVGIFMFLLAIWSGIGAMILWNPFAIFWAIYYVISGIINLMIFMQIPEYDSLIRSRRYGEAKDRIFMWAILGIIFGFLVGLLLILIIFLYLEELDRTPVGYHPPRY